jgi:phage gp29-like protein
MKKLWINEREYVLFNEAKTKLSDEIAVRNRSIDFYSILQNLPDPDPVLRKQGKDFKVYKEFLSDPHVWACVQSRKSGVLSLLWEIDRGKAKSKQAQIIENLFKSLDLNTIISEILNAVLFGFQPLEVIWQSNGSYTLPSAVKAKPPEWFVFDNNNNLKFRTKENYNGELLPPRKFLCAQYEPTYENPYGERTMSRIFWNVTMKRNGQRFWIKFIEKYGMPFLVAKHPRGTDKSENKNLLNMLEAMVHDAVAVIPDDSSVEIQEAAKTSSSEAYEGLIDKMNAEISKAILGQTLTTEINNKGSFAASKIHMEVKKEITDADKRIVERTLNQLIQWIYELNFAGQSDIPVFTMYEEEDVDLTLAQRDKILADAGVKFTKKYLMKTYGFDEEDIEVSDTEKQGSPKNKNNLKPENSFREFKETQAVFPDQQTIDNFIDSFSADELQEQAKAVFGSVFELVNRASSYEEIQEKLSGQGLKTDQIEKVLQKVIFISEIWGHLNGND